jgi:hypothetical protein
MLEVYKKLPGTNCGECGEAACMAFAMKVKTHQRSISDCPYVSEAESESTPVEAVEKLDDMYERVSNKMEAEVTSIDFELAAAAIGGDFEVVDGEETIQLKMTSKPYQFRRQGLFEGGELCPDSWVKMIIYDYIGRQGSKPVNADWVPFDSFPNTPSHIKAFQTSAENQLAAAFAQDPEGIKTHFTKQGGREEQGPISTDYACCLNLLPRIPLLLRFWAADSEFPASCKLFVDSSADAYLDIEFLGHLVEKFVEETANETGAD